MEKSDLRLLVSTGDRVVAENIKNLLEDFNINTMLVSDNPASSYMSSYFGFNPAETIEIMININDYQQALQIINESPYREFVDQNLA
jgi:hypothetical protein